MPPTRTRRHEDLIMGAFVLLLTSATFLVAINQAGQVSEHEVATPPPLVVAPRPPPQTVNVDYGMRGAVFDQQPTFEFPPTDNPIEPVQYDTIYPEHKDAVWISVEGVDGVSAEIQTALAKHYKRLESDQKARVDAMFMRVADLEREVATRNVKLSELEREVAAKDIKFAELENTLNDKKRSYDDVLKRILDQIHGTAGDRFDALDASRADGVGSALPIR